MVHDKVSIYLIMALPGLFLDLFYNVNKISYLILYFILYNVFIFYIKLSNLSYFIM